MLTVHPSNVRTKDHSKSCRQETRPSQLTEEDRKSSYQWICWSLHAFVDLEHPVVVSEPKNRGSPPNKGHPLVPTQPQEWTEICHLNTPDQVAKFIYKDVTSRFWGEWCRGLTIGYKENRVEINWNRNTWSIIAVRYFGVSCLMACDTWSSIVTGHTLKKGVASIEG